MHVKRLEQPLAHCQCSIPAMIDFAIVCMTQLQSPLLLKTVIFKNPGLFLKAHQYMWSVIFLVFISKTLWQTPKYDLPTERFWHPTTDTHTHNCEHRHYSLSLLVKPTCHLKARCGLPCICAAYVLWMASGSVDPQTYNGSHKVLKEYLGKYHNNRIVHFMSHLTYPRTKTTQVLKSPKVSYLESGASICYSHCTRKIMLRKVLLRPSIYRLGSLLKCGFLFSRSQQSPEILHS